MFLEEIYKMDTPPGLSAIMGWLGSKKSAKKAKAVRENGKKGGRPVNPNSLRQKRLNKSEK